MMNETSYCGLICNTCPIYLATLEPDKSRQRSMRESIAEQCSKLYGMEVLPDDVTDCDGCKEDKGRLFSGCLQCEIRNCADQKNIENCAFCDDYACAILRKHFLLDPDAQKRLEEIRQAFRN